MQLVLGPSAAALHIWLDLAAASALQLHISAASVAEALTMAPKLKLADRHIRWEPLQAAGPLTWNPSYQEQSAEARASHLLIEGV